MTKMTGPKGARTTDAAMKATSPKRASKKTATAPPLPRGKIPTLIDLLKQPGGTTIAAMMAATGWQAHSVRGAISGSIKKALGLEVLSEKTDAGRVYRIVAEAQS